MATGTRRIALLGATGSIGRQALEIVDMHDDLRTCALSSGSQPLDELAARHGVDHFQVGGDLTQRLDASEPDLVLNAVVGFVGVGATLWALERGVTLALANKESLVAAGDLAVAAWKRGGGLLLLVRDVPEHGFWAVIAVMFTVFAADTAAFFVGRTLGRHAMAPAISPAKTWEGVIAGVLAAMAAAFLILYKDRDEFLTIPETLLLGVVVALASVFGDLFESAVKRDLQRKDSGRLLGGHGGMLDRLDALLWSGPAAYFVILAVS